MYNNGKLENAAFYLKSIRNNIFICCYSLDIMYKGLKKALNHNNF